MKFCKYIVLWYVAIINCISLFGQNKTFCWTFAQREVSVGRVIENKKGDYIFLAAQKDTNAGYFDTDSALIILWNWQGDSIVKKFKPEGYINPVFYEVECKNDGGYIVFGFLQYPNSTHAEDTADLWVMGFDSNLNVQWDYRYPIAQNYSFIHDLESFYNGRWLMSIEFCHLAWLPQTVPQIFLIEIDANGQLTRTLKDTVGWIYDIVLHPDSNRFYLLGDYFDPGTPTTVWTMIYDTNFQLLEFKPMFPRFIESPYSGFWDDDTLIFSGYYGLAQSDICLYKMIENVDSIKAVRQKCFVYPTNDDVQYHSIIKTKDNHYIQFGTLDFINHCKAWLGCYDKQFNLLNYKIYIESNTHISAGPLYPTSDSGYFAFFSKVKFGTNHNFDSISVIKFDKYGQVTGINAPYQVVQRNKCQVYPNPGSDFFEVQVYNNLYSIENYTIELWSITGQFAGQWSAAGHKTIINTEFLKPGMYFYRISSQNQIIDSGKWIKHKN